MEDAIMREVYEETGITITNPQFLFYKNVDLIYRYSLIMVFESENFSGTLKSSWEGKAYWNDHEQIKNNMAFDQSKIIDKFLKEYNS